MCVGRGEGVTAEERGWGRSSERVRKERCLWGPGEEEGELSVEGGRAAEAPGEAEKAQSCACGMRRVPESCFSLPCLLPPLLTSCHSFKSTQSRIPPQTVGGWWWSRGLTETTGRRIPSGCTQLWWGTGGREGRKKADDQASAEVEKETRGVCGRSPFSAKWEQTQGEVKREDFGTTAPRPLCVVGAGGGKGVRRGDLKT